MLINTESYDDYDLDDYEQAQDVCLHNWMEHPVIDRDGNILGWASIDEPHYHM